MLRTICISALFESTALSLVVKGILNNGTIGRLRVVERRSINYLLWTLCDRFRLARFFIGEAVFRVSTPSAASVNVNGCGALIFIMIGPMATS